MTEVYHDSWLQVWQGDCREVMAGLEAGSVHMVATSPPYYGLRDYGTATWIGGDPECPHKLRVDPHTESSTLGGGKDTVGHQQKGFRHVCRHCGAVRAEPAVWGGDPEHEHIFGSGEQYAGHRGTRGQVPQTKHKTNDTYPQAQSHQRQGATSLRAGRSNVDEQLSDTIRRTPSGTCECGAWAGQLGLEPTPEMYVEHMVEVARSIRRVLRDDGTFWLNLGDSYWSTGGAGGTMSSSGAVRGAKGQVARPEAADPAAFGRWNRRNQQGIKPKDLIGIPWMVAFALRADGWYLRSDVIWCLSPLTRLYARTQHAEGPMPLGDLTRLDPATVQLWNGERWTQVRGWSSRQSETIRLTIRSGERIIASPEHRWPLANGGLVETQALVVGDVLASAPLPEPATTDDIPEDLAWFAGLYLAEGSRSGEAIQIAGHAKEVARHERVAAIAKRYGGTCALYPNRGQGVTVNVHSAFLDAAIRHFVAGRTALDKHLHPRAWRSSNATLRAFMDGYLAGDGHHDIKNGRWRLGFGNNPQWVESLRTLAARLGATLTVNPSLARVGRTLTFESYRGEWRWSPPAHHTRARTEIVKIEHRAPTEVWDVGVADEPHTFALASGVLTHNSKPNAMPESVEDRPTSAHEHLFLFAKRERYFYDAEAVREAQSDWTYARGAVAADEAGVGSAATRGLARGITPNPSGRNLRNVWTIATQPYPGAHFATWPQRLVEPMIKAGTSERGVCPECGAPWERTTGRPCTECGAAIPTQAKECPECRFRDTEWPDQRVSNEQTRAGESDTLGPLVVTPDVGSPGRIETDWRPTCRPHPDEPEEGRWMAVPATILDPFAGSGTTGMVAQQLSRRAILIDLNSGYLTEQALKRNREIPLGL